MGSLGKPLVRLTAAMQSMQCLRDLCFLRPYTAFFDPTLRALLAKGTLRRLLIFGISIYHKIPFPDLAGAASLDLLILAYPYVPPFSVVGRNMEETLRMAEHLLLVLPENGTSPRSVHGVEGMFQAEGIDGACRRNKVVVTERRLSPFIESVFNGDVWRVQRMT